MVVEPVGRRDDVNRVVRAKVGRLAELRIAREVGPQPHAPGGAALEAVAGIDGRGSLEGAQALPVVAEVDLRHGLGRGRSAFPRYSAFDNKYRAHVTDERNGKREAFL